MRTIAFGYSTHCNIRCRHCVAADGDVQGAKMDLAQAKDIINELSLAGVGGISFSAGEPFIYFTDLLELVALCQQKNIYTRVVTNSYWAKTPEKAIEFVARLKHSGLCQLRLSYSRWHQENIPRQNVVNGVRGCIKAGVNYYISFVTDFSEKDEKLEQFLRDNRLKYFPEPIIYAGRAESFGRKMLFTDYQANICSMNPYLAPDLTMYGCCDAGSHFDITDFFKLGNLKKNSIRHLFSKWEALPLYKCIRSMGITNIGSFAGVKSSEIVTYQKCELCKKIFNSPKTLKFLEGAVDDLQQWIR